MTTEGPHDHRDKWDDADVAALLTLAAQGTPTEGMAPLLGRTEMAVDVKLRRLGWHKRRSDGRWHREPS